MTGSNAWTVGELLDKLKQYDDDAPVEFQVVGVQAERVLFDDTTHDHNPPNPVLNIYMK